MRPRFELDALSHGDAGPGKRTSPGLKKGIAVSASPRLAHAIESFSTYLRVERNLAPRSREAYVYDLERFRTWMEGPDGDRGVTLRTVTPEVIQAYLGHLRDALNYKATTMNRVVAALKVFFDFCLEEKLIARSPASEIARPRLPRKLPVYLSRDEIVQRRKRNRHMHQREYHAHPRHHPPHFFVCP